MTDQLTKLISAGRKLIKHVSHADTCDYTRFSTMYSKGYAAAPSDEEEECTCGLTEFRNALGSEDNRSTT